MSASEPVSWSVLEGHLQARPRWRRIGREWHGPCPVRGIGENTCWFAPGARTPVRGGCRKCGGRLSSPDFREHLALADVDAAGGSASGGGLNGVSADPPAPPRPAGSAERVPRRAADSAGDAHIVFSGKAGALVERLLGAMRDSTRARVESVRRVWIDADGVSGGWDLWALDPAVIDRVPGLQRGVER